MNGGVLLAAIHFSAEKHREQRRKAVDASPYINHPIEVAAMLANIAGVHDEATLTAAVLHEVTDDKSLPKAERKRLQVEHAARLIKIADKVSNMREVIDSPPAGWSLERRREVLSQRT